MVEVSLLPAVPIAAKESGGAGCCRRERRSGELFRGGFPAANTISVGLNAAGDAVTTTIGSTTNTFPLADVKKIVVVGGAAADNITVDLPADSSQRVSVFGGGGDDTITTGAEDDVISGGAGADVIHAGAGENRVAAGDRDDTISSGH